MSHTFISYAREDINIAERIVKALAENDLNTWVDWKNIPKAEDWKEEIFRGIEEADSFLFLITTDSVTSQVCNEEIDHALKNGKRIVPILIGNTKEGKIYKDAHEITDNFIFQHLKSEINRRNFIFCSENLDEFNQSIEQIKTTIRTDYKWLEDHTNLQLKALEWEKRNKKGGLLSGTVLRDAQEKIALSSSKDPQPTDLQRLFVNESQKAETRNRNWILTIAGIVIAALATISLFANNQRILALNNEATSQANLVVAQTAQADAQSQAATAQAASTLAVEQSNIAIANLEKFQISRSADIAAQSLIVRDTKYSLSMLLSIEAFNVRETGDTYSLLLNNVYASPELPPDEVVAKYTDSRFNELALSPDGKLLASISWSRFSEGDKIYDEKTIILWSTNVWQPIAFLEGHTGSVDNLVFSPDSKLLASSSYDDNNIIFWNTETHQIVGKISINKYSDKMEFTSDGKYFITLHNERLKAWDITTISLKNQPAGKYLNNFDLGYIAYGGFALSPNRNILAVNEYDGIILRDANTGLAISPRLTEGRDYVDGMAFSPDGKLFAASDNGEIKFWDANTYQPIGHPLKTGIFDVRQIIFSPDSKTLLSHSSENIIIWDIKNAQPIGPKIILERSSYYLSPDGRTLISGYDTGLALWNIGRIVDIRDRPNIRQLFVDTENILGITFSSDNKTLSLSESKWDGNNFEAFIESIDIETGKITDKINNPFTGNYNHIAYDQQENILVIRDEGSPSHLFITSIRKGNFGTDFNIPDTATSSISISHDLQKIILGNHDGSITIWDFTTEQIVGLPIQVYIDEVLSVAINPNENILASSNREGIISLTDVLTGKLLGQFQSPSKEVIISLAFSHDGKTLASASENGTILLWDLDTDAWLNKVCQQAGRNFTYSEWLEYFPSEEYSKTCDQWDLGTKVIVTPTATP